MGSGYNTSLASGRGARRTASIRTPIHFWLDVPMYEYELHCGNGNHTFLSRTPISPLAIDLGDDYEDYEDYCVVWCDKCQEYRVIDDVKPEPLNRPVSTDEVTAFEQDKGLIREKIARELQNRGLLTEESQLAKAAVEFGVPVREIRLINAGLVATDEPDMCQAGLHLLTEDNISFTRGRRQCKACRAIAQKNRRAANRNK